MRFELTEEQQMIVDTTRTFTERELMPYEEQVERDGHVTPDLVNQIKQRSIDAGIYA
ncbi:MAG: acyl-CoA dehydrogenase family protein, partial [Acidimicrobiaceae bacterium]